MANTKYVKMVASILDPSGNADFFVCRLLVTFRFPTREEIHEALVKVLEDRGMDVYVTYDERDPGWQYFDERFNWNSAEVIEIKN